jgi:hypothetical protein
MEDLFVNLSNNYSLLLQAVHDPKILKMFYATRVFVKDNYEKPKSHLQVKTSVTGAEFFGSQRGCLPSLSNMQLRVSI